MSCCGQILAKVNELWGHKLVSTTNTEQPTRNHKPSIIFHRALNYVVENMGRRQKKNHTHIQYTHTHTIGRRAPGQCSWVYRILSALTLFSVHGKPFSCVSFTLGVFGSPLSTAGQSITELSPGHPLTLHDKADHISILTTPRSAFFS